MRIWINSSLFSLGLLLMGAHWMFPKKKATHLMVEICNNGIDDDGDELIDINDPDCECPIIEPISRIPNPSFEDRTCCPNNRSELNCAETWIQASAPTTDYLHTCGWMGWEQFPPPLPFPDGNGAVGFRDGRNIQGESEPTWKEYAGACLLAPLRAGVDYRFQFHVGFSLSSSPSINITFFGNTDCKSLPFGVNNQMLGCPTNDTTGWIKLGSVGASGSFVWAERRIDVTPEQDIYAIAIGPDCREIDRSFSTYYFFDNLILDEQRAFDFQIQAVNHPCSEQFQLSIPEIRGTEYQWYKDGIALVGETNPLLNVSTGEGQYQVRIQNEEGCKITNVFPFLIPRFEKEVAEYICKGESYAFGGQEIMESGSYIGTFRSERNCDSTVFLNLEVIDPITTAQRAKIFEGDTYEIGSYKIKENGQHLVPLVSSLGCDSTIDLNIEYYKIYIPNVFSPNGDGINDRFNISGESDLEAIKYLQVYSRWGELLFEQDNLKPNDQSQGWDGSLNQENVPEGLYIFHSRVVMKDGQERTFSGDIMLVR